MTKEFIDFVNTHKEVDTARLLFSASRYPSIDMPAAVNQIEGLRMAREKWPWLEKQEGYEYPPRLNREQASSEATARYKATVCQGCQAAGRIADLTGGMGIDALALAIYHRAAGISLPQVDYVERDPQLCALMERNLQALGIGNVTVHCADSMEWLSTQESFDLLYIDPARRSTDGHKVAAFEDCTPDILQHMSLLHNKCRRLMVKASPMIDISRATAQLGHVAEVHIVAVKGECKEVLFLCDGAHDGTPIVHCVNLNGSQVPSDFRFTRDEELTATATYSNRVGRYLYDPHAALRKGGCFRLLAQHFGLPLLAPNTHLYTSDTLLPDFPGRTFEVMQEISLNRKQLKPILPDGKAHVVTRNFPTEAATLQKQLGLREGGELYLIATTIGTQRTGFLCRHK